MEREIEEELLDIAKRRYRGERQGLLDLLELKEREIEDLRVVIKDQEQKLRDAGAALEEERLQRGEELVQYQIEMEKFQKAFDRERKASVKDDELNNAIVEGLNQQILERKKELEKAYEENRRVLNSFKEQITSRTSEVESLKRHERELENKIVALESSAKEEARKFAEKILALEEMLSQEKQAHSKLEDASKTALTSSTAALLEERSKLVSLQNRVSDLAQALTKIEGEKRLAIESWERDRKKWEELWERERKVWENQRVSFSDWEAKHLKEKALWEKMIAEKEEKEIRLTRVFGNLISELSRAGKNWGAPSGTSSDAGEIPAKARFDEEIESSLSNVQKNEASKELSSGATAKAPWAAGSKILRFVFWSAVAALLVMAAYGGVWLARWISGGNKEIAMKETASWDAPVESPSGLAQAPGRDDVLWLSDWKSGAFLEVSALEPSRVIHRYEPKNNFFHPNSIAVSPDGKYLFALDSVARKITRHDAGEPSKILEDVPTPSASSLYLALISSPQIESKTASVDSDSAPNLKSPASGLVSLAPSTQHLAPSFLAVLDTVERQVYLYDPRTLKAKPQEAFKIPKEVMPLALGAQGDLILILDGATRQIYRYGQNAKGEWRNQGVVRVDLDSGPGLLSTATSLLSRGDDLYLVLEMDPPQIILVRK